ncbi:hypothetical protein DY000_02018862, partial [Brassica cretica]
YQRHSLPERLVGEYSDTRSGVSKPRDPLIRNIKNERGAIVVVNFLMEENCFLTAFELLHELLDYGHDAQTIRLKEFFSDPSRFSPDQISWYNSIRVADPQSLLEEKEALSEKLAISEYEFRLAQEDITRLKTEGQKRSDCSIDKLKVFFWYSSNKITKPSYTVCNFSEVDTEEFGDKRPEVQRKKKDFSFTDIGPLKNNERRDLKCAVKEISSFSRGSRGYILNSCCQKDKYLETCSNCNFFVFENRIDHEKIAMLQENESLKKEIERLNKEKDGLFRSEEKFEEQISAFNNIQVQSLKQSSEHQRRNLNDCRAEITSLKMHIEGSRAGQYVSATEGEKQISSLPEEVEKPAMEKDGGLISESSIPVEDLESILKVDSGIGRGSNLKSENANGEAAFKETGLGTIQILADALPNIVPYVLINHREV